MNQAAPSFAPLSSTMIQRMARLDAAAVMPDDVPAMSDLRWFLTAFVGGFIFFSALIA